MKIPSSIQRVLPAGTGWTIFLVASLILWISSAGASSIKHLVAPDSAADCYECHKKATPKIAEDWYESKHGVVLMKCFVCHGQPDGKGSVPWAVVPSPRAVCQKCHDPAMKRMTAKYGLKLDCYTCHPFHQNSLHHEAYKKSESKSK
jgi:hypothetical protein